ncbi:uncharacterized protein LOC127789008 [Diospyros lotus]|uniref:uncharacterized protein LOC127789008 n=1 Tax=Diospyros lotus TaxID=55363 RepID=UPI0022529303|nr:uncharacterized protein LOC127789008 [Diospyros lotus]
MTSVCVSKCVHDARVPVRATYANLYKWPESDAEFVMMRAVGRGCAAEGNGAGWHPPPRVVDSISCRQLYLRSYTFSRKETVPERTKQCLDRVRERMAAGRLLKKKKKKKKKAPPGRALRVKELSCAIFQRLLSCTASVDVVEG